MALNGIDVSGWQPENITALVDYDFAFIKATEGVSYVSGACDPQYQAAKRRGKLLGVYHFAAGHDPVAEADHFVKNVAGYVGEAILVLDFEADAVSAWGGAGAKRFLDRVLAKTGVRPLIYASASVAARSDMRAIAAADYGLWVAAWGSNPAGGYRVPPKAPTGAWSFVAVHQYSARGRLKGYAGDLDLDIFHGDAAAWRAYAAKGGKAPAAPKPEAKPKPKPKPAAKPSSAKTYTVRSGDTLSGIAGRFGTTVAKLVSANGIKDPDLIHPGQVLKLSGTSAAPSKAKTYKVRVGDNLTRIAAAHGTTVAALASKNGVKNPDLIHPGQVLKL